jgi:hypothetical protein
MLDERAQAQIGRHLRTVYDGIPKGGIPRRIWRLLLEMEQKLTPGTRKQSPSAG